MLKSEDASTPNFSKQGLVSLVDVLADTILNDEWLISGDIPADVERSLRVLLAHANSDPSIFSEYLFSDERLYATVLQQKEQILQAPLVLRFIKCLSRILLGVDPKSGPAVQALDIFRVLTSDRVTLTFMSNPEIGVVELFMELALSSDDDRLISCLCEITKLSRVKSFRYRVNKRLLAEITERIMSRDKTSLGSLLGFLANICENNQNCRDLQNLSAFDSLIRYLVALLGQNDFDYLIVVKALLIIARLSQNASVGGNFFTEGNIAETVKMIFSVLTKAASRKDIDGSIELLEEICKSIPLCEAVNRYLKSNKLVKSAFQALSSEPTTQDQAFQLFAVLVRHHVCEEHILFTLNEASMLSDLAAWIQSVAVQKHSSGQQYAACENAFQLISDLSKSRIFMKSDKAKRLYLEFSKIATSIIELLDTIFVIESLTPRLSYLLSFAVDSVEALNLTLSVCRELAEGLSNAHGEGIRRIFDRLIRTKVEDNCLSWLLVPISKIVIDMHDANIDVLRRENILSDKLHRSIQICLGTCPFSPLIDMAVEITKVWPNEFPLPLLIAQENRFRLFQHYSKFLTEVHQKATTKRRDYSMGRASSSFGIDFQMLDGLASFRAERPTEHSFMRVEDADKSITALSQLEKEVEFMEHRMKKEIELKNAISERKISAYEIKIASMKAELAEAKSSEFARTLSTFERENHAMKLESESLKKELRSETEKNKAWEGQISKLQFALSSMQGKLAEKELSIAASKETIEGLNTTLSATTIEKDNMIQMLRSRLENALKENVSLKEACSSKDVRVVDLEKKVKELEDESRVHEDIVSKLAESLEGLSMRRKK
ncbi:hypothetical protein HDU67_006635 [Dinochytrium kinnereticum]|nr:hypothetical protein HDU67_006635 [Dinochytrium kinnereticum]